MLIAPFGEGSRLSKDAARAAGRVDEDRSGACTTAQFSERWSARACTLLLKIDI